MDEIEEEEEMKSKLKNKKGRENPKKTDSLKFGLHMLPQRNAFDFIRKPERREDVVLNHKKKD